MTPEDREFIEKQVGRIVAALKVDNNFGGLIYFALMLIFLALVCNGTRH